MCRGLTDIFECVISSVWLLLTLNSLTVDAITKSISCFNAWFDLQQVQQTVCHCDTLQQALYRSPKPLAKSMECHDLADTVKSRQQFSKSNFFYVLKKW